MDVIQRLGFRTNLKYKNYAYFNFLYNGGEYYRRIWNNYKLSAVYIHVVAFKLDLNMSRIWIFICKSALKNVSDLSNGAATTNIFCGQLASIWQCVPNLTAKNVIKLLS